MIPDSAPEEYKKLAERCCDADPDKRPDTKTLKSDIEQLIYKVNKSGDMAWNAIYQNDIKSFSRLEKIKYSSKPLFYRRNSYEDMY